MAKFITELPIISSTVSTNYWLLVETDGTETYKADLGNILNDTKEKLKIAVRQEIVNNILKPENEIVLKPTVVQSMSGAPVLNYIDLNYDGFYNTTNTYKVHCFISGYYEGDMSSSTLPSIIECILYVKNDVVIGAIEPDASLWVITSGQTDMKGTFSSKPDVIPSGIITIRPITNINTSYSGLPMFTMRIDVNKSAPLGVISYSLYSTPADIPLTLKIKIKVQKIG